jgi:N-ethylmaleimide reductase
MQYPYLFSDIMLGQNHLANRIVMAPMTRSRSTQPGNVPNSLMAQYYGQRASAGLIITEATQISVQGQGYAGTPGIHTPQQVAGWKQVTDAVHSRGGTIYMQLWHVGRVGSAAVNGLQPLAPSGCIARDTVVYLTGSGGAKDVTFIPVDKPREMTPDDIAATTADFARAARNAMEAGFDGVEIHGANGYLIDQFLRSNSNKRTDSYGGSPAARIRFLREVTQAVIAQTGKDKVGVRLSPFIKFKDMDDPEILNTIMLAAAMLDSLGAGYLHLCEADWDDAPQIPVQFRHDLRSAFKGRIIATGNKTPQEAEVLISTGLIDLAGFGRKILANPDFAERVRQGAPLNTITDTHTIFGGGGAAGYTDYPFLKTE